MNPLPGHSRFRSNDDLGFGLKAAAGRSVNKDGTFNVRRKGLPLVRSYELYHRLISLGGFRFLGLLLLGFLLVNALFACIYLWIGMDHFARPGGEGTFDRICDAFFFSTQTLTTVGYGHISPKSHLVSAVAALESLLGLLSFALATGLLYGRFSRPHAQLCFSDQALVAPYRGITAFMFRFANRRTNQLIEVEATVSLSMLEAGSGTRRFLTLSLERGKINLFPTSWTVVHPIDEASPLFGLSAEDLLRSQAEFIVLIKAFDDTFAQTIYQRTSYIASEVVWGARFQPMTSVGADGKTVMDVDRVNAMEDAPAGL